MNSDKLLFKLSPSDFAFLYEGCKRCFYLKVIHDIKQPSIDLPGIFSKIAGLLKTHYHGKNTQDIHSELPPGRIEYGEEWIESKPFTIKGHSSGCYIKGRFDIVAKFEDDSYGVFDFKTGNPREEHSDLYGRQLHAYAYALEHAAPGALTLSPIKKLGLFYFPPKRTLQNSPEKLLYEADIHYNEIPKNDRGFFKFIDEVLGILEKPAPPEGAKNCKWCNYLERISNLKS